ncbi:MAG: DUF1858 domain-containing protein [Candidatus Marinimicrobia bacterium]|nr:DUF1858 domain-containing protein [Candidatus Neomarinimicrobiota bacterium]
MITENVFIEDLVKDHPEVIRPLADHGLVCIACGEPVWGTLQQLADNKGVTDLDNIIKELNELIQSN